MTKKLSALEIAAQTTFTFVLRSLIQPWSAVIGKALKAKKAAVEAAIKATTRSITVRTRHFLLSIGIDAGFNANEIQSEIATAKSETDAVAVLEGMGFEVRGEFA